MQNLPSVKQTIGQLNKAVSQHFTSLLVNTLAMIIVARNFDISGFGVFSYLVAFFHIASFISDCGICNRFRDHYIEESDRNKNLKDSRGALFCTAILTFLFLILTAYNSRDILFNPAIIGYLLLAVAVPLANGNRLCTTLLHASGKHDKASSALTRKQILFLISLWVLSQTQESSLLMAAYLISEVYHRISLRKFVKLPTLFQGDFFRKSIGTIRLSLSHLFSGETFSLIFHTDLFILGLFTNSMELGIYAQAALMGRFFLLVPGGVRPILHRHLAGFKAKGDAYGFSLHAHRIRAYMFYFHALVVLLVTLYFDGLIQLITGSSGDLLSFNVFLLMLPGYLYYTATIVHEAALEASGSGPFLSRLSTFIIGLNILINFYLIPFAGMWGAASATLFCLILYFCLLCKIKITIFSTVTLLEFLVAGAILYPIQKLIIFIDVPIFLFIIIAPPIIYLLFYLLKFFDFEVKPTSPQNRVGQ